jgi:hypothetical protein
MNSLGGGQQTIILVVLLRQMHLYSLPALLSNLAYHKGYDHAHCGTLDDQSISLKIVNTFLFKVSVHTSLCPKLGYRSVKEPPEFEDPCGLDDAGSFTRGGVPC